MRGKLHFAIAVVQLYQDHPRGCGENLQFQPMQISDPGSPPRMRGKLLEDLKAAYGDRITPADAGKTYLHRI